MASANQSSFIPLLIEQVLFHFKFKSHYIFSPLVFHANRHTGKYINLRFPAVTQFLTFVLK